MADSQSTWQHPRAWLYAWDFARDSGRFLRIDDNTLRQSSFLDQRIAADTSRYDEVPMTELLAHPDPGALCHRPPVFIFHTAFCCSTLLARSLDLPGRSLALREPATLLQLADLRRGRFATNRKESELLAPTLRFLAQPCRNEERLVIKPTNLVNNIAPELLGKHPGSRAILLYDDLEAFLLAVLKRPRESARGLAQFLERLLADPVGRQWAATRTPPESLAERAALVWALQIRAIELWLDGNPGIDLRVLSANELLCEPPAALLACAEWATVPLSSAEAADIVNGPAWTRHAKHPAAAYTPDQRRTDQARARRLLAEPLRAALAWADDHQVGRHARLPDNLRLLP